VHVVVSFLLRKAMRGKTADSKRGIVNSGRNAGSSPWVHTLVPSDRVETAAVYGRDGQKIGTIERLMLEKMTGTVAYAVVRGGGFLKSDKHHYPVPWNSLKYNVARKAYDTDLTLEELRSRPSELDGDEFDWGDRSLVYRHPQYWSV
jgi:sporulation protein YlmC with PRC-barrel domain